MDLQEIRNNINTMDTMAGNLIEYLNHRNNEAEEDIPKEVQRFQRTLDDLQEEITSVQQQQKWI